MPPQVDDKIVSNIEITLPHKVIERCYNLETGIGAEFNSVNSHLGTSSKIKVWRISEDFVKIKLIVTSLETKEKEDNSNQLKKKGTTGRNQLLSTRRKPKRESKSCKETESHESSKYASVVDADSSEQTIHRPKRQCAERKFSHPKYGEYSLKNAARKKKRKSTNESQDGVTHSTNQCNIAQETDDSERLTVEKASMVSEDAEKQQQTAVDDETSGTDFSSKDHNDCSDDSDGEDAEDANHAQTSKVRSKTVKAVVDRSKMKRPHYKREHNIPCFLCPAKLKDYDSVFDHFRLKHTRHEQYDYHMAQIKQLMKAQCHECGKIFARKEMLNQHVSVKHREQIRVTCPHCNLSIRSEKHLKDHVRRMHMHTGKKHLCHLCPASFRLPEYLNSHIKCVHSEGPAQACSECGKQYSSLKFLRNHKARVHGEKRHACLYCGKKFMTAPNMRRHIQLIHEQPNERSFACSYCSRRFTLKGNLKEHEQTVHLKQYQHRCNICNLGFRRKAGLKTHQERDCPGAIINMLQGNDLGQPILFLPHGEGRQEPLTVESVEDLQRVLTEYMPAQKIPKKILPKPCTSATPDTEQNNGLLTPVNAIMPSDAQKNDSSVQYIVATPEILKEFGVSLPVDTEQPDSLLRELIDDVI